MNRDREQGPASDCGLSTVETALSGVLNRHSATGLALEAVASRREPGTWPGSEFRGSGSLLLLTARLVVFGLSIALILLSRSRIGSGRSCRLLSFITHSNIPLQKT
jgi:hypothetical protein